MKDNEAVDLIRMMKAATKTSTLTDDREAFWMEQLTPLDAELATKTVTSGISVWEFFPSWADFARIYQGFTRQAVEARESEERRQHDEELAREGRLALPFWLKRYAVARHVVSPPDLRVFPEQNPGPGDELMPDDAYVEEAKKITDAEALRTMRKSAQSGKMVGGAA